MAGPHWDLFAGIVIIVVIVMLWMARVTQRALYASAEPTDPPGADGVQAPSRDARSETRIERWSAPNNGFPALLYLNVVLSHSLFGGILIVAVWITQIPPGAFGIAGTTMVEITLGVALGAGVAAANEASKHFLTRATISHSEQLRELLAPSSIAGWIVLLVVVLPVIAVVEELIFRGALIGVLAAGYEVSVWMLAVASSILFGLGHGTQGPGGIVVTAVLGFVLAAGFIVTGSLLVVIVAHYVVNATEFILHESPLRNRHT